MQTSQEAFDEDDWEDDDEGYPMGVWEPYESEGWDFTGRWEPADD